MAYLESLLSVSSGRIDFVRKIYTEIISKAVSIANDIYNNNSSNISEREIRKTKFLSLVNESNQLLENEKEYAKRRFIYEFELDNSVYKLGKLKECNKCKSTRYSDNYCENCIYLHLQELFNTLTSGNDIIDNFIQKCQKLSSLPGHIIEWISFDQFNKVKYLTKGGFGTIYTTTWIRGYIHDYDKNKKEFTYFRPQHVVLKY
jgi:hypothetical protein